MRNRFLTATATALALALAGCAATAPMGETPTLRAETPPPGAIPGPGLWRVADADTTIYLFGTVHALPPDTLWFDERVQRAFDSSGKLVTEIDIAEMAAQGQNLMAAGMLPEGQTLRGLMSAENRAEYEAALTTLGLPLEALDRMEPWFAAMTLSLLPLLQAGYEAESGVDMALTAKAGGKERGALETIEEQIALFDTLPMAAQLKLLDEAVEMVPEAATMLNAMVAEWLEGDAVGLATMLNEELDDPVLYERLLTQRNANWAEWIEQRMATPGTVFMAVGAGHLAGEGSVQEKLEQRGLTVTRVWK